MQNKILLAVPNIEAEEGVGIGGVSYAFLLVHFIKEFLIKIILLIELNEND